MDTSDVKHIAIKIEPQPTRPFLPGEIVSGTATLTTEKESVQVAKIIMKISGKCHVEWKEKVRHREWNAEIGEYETTTKTVTRDQTIEFFELKIPLESGGKVLSKGDNVYNFSFTIPEYARSSFKGQYGSVKYLAKVKADCPWGKDAEETLHFYVNAINDLNKQQAAPYEAKKSKTFGFLCCASGPLTVKMSLEKTGFVCGECIKIVAEVNNKSDKRIGAVNVSMVQKISYTPGPKEYNTIESYNNNTKIEAIKEFSIGAVDPGAEEVLEYQLKVPTLIPTEDKDRINISYALNMEADPEGVGLDLNMPEVPIIIANIPHKKAFANFDTEEATVELSDKIKTEYADIPKVNHNTKYIVYSWKKI